MKITKEWEVGIGYVTGLTDLNLNGNLVEAFPPTLDQCSDLQHLNLGRNLLTEVAMELQYNTALVTLDLSGNQLESVPEELVELSRLTSLTLDNNTTLTKLPPLGAPGSGLCSSLTDLKINGCGFDHAGALAASLLGLTSLAELEVDRNKLTALPIVPGVDERDKGDGGGDEDSDADEKGKKKEKKKKEKKARSADGRHGARRAPSTPSPATPSGLGGSTTHTRLNSKTFTYPSTPSNPSLPPSLTQFDPISVVIYPLQRPLDRTTIADEPERGRQRDHRAGRAPTFHHQDPTP